MAKGRVLSTSRDPLPPVSPLRHTFPLAFLLALGCEPGPPPEGVIGTEVDDAVQREVAAARGRLSATEGGRLVLRAVDAHGGLEAWYRAPTSAYTWAYADRDADLQFESYLVADNRTRRVHHDLRAVGLYGAPRPVEGRFAWDGTDAWIAPDSLTRLDPRFWATASYYVELIPFVLADPGLHYERLPDDTLDGRPHHVVRVNLGPVSGSSPVEAYTLYLDRDASRVGAIRYAVPYGRAADPAVPLRETLLRGLRDRGWADGADPLPRLRVRGRPDWAAADRGVGRQPLVPPPVRRGAAAASRGSAHRAPARVRLSR